MINDTREHRTTEDEGGFEGAEYNQRGNEAGQSAQGEIEVEEHHAAGSRVEGEGSYEAAREYERRLSEFVSSGRVEQAANDAAVALDVESEGQAQAEGSACDAGDDVAVHVKHERQGWVVEPGAGTGPAAIFDTIDDALRRAHELAAEQHLPLFVHGPDGELIDKFDAL
ncbi:MAG TPA: DUF2188 domain-containing protein [Haliangium sp.]|nr:DUF2188 domain-containing protein [Haliangium sp.]